jgi:uncharacterized protein (DUF4415 family)
VPERQPKKKKKTLKRFKQEDDVMKKEYDLKSLKFKANPYINKLKKSVTIRLDTDVIDYFKELSEETSTPYQTLLNDFLRNCKELKLRPKTIWKKVL